MQQCLRTLGTGWFGEKCIHSCHWQGPLCIYGDLAYPLRLHLQQPFREAPLTAPMEQFKRSTSTVRISVEWIFGDIVASFKFLDFKKNLKIGLSAVGKHYVVSALLQNALTCMYGNTTATFFDIEPPSLEEYFAWNYNLIVWISKILDDLIVLYELHSLMRFHLLRGLPLLASKLREK